MQDMYDWNIDMNDQGMPTWSIVEKNCIGIVTLAGILDIKSTLDRYILEWMGDPSGSYCLEVVHQFYTFYFASIYLINPARQLSWNHHLLAHMLVRGTWVDLSKETIRIFLLPSYKM